MPLGVFELSLLFFYVFKMWGTILVLLLSTSAYFWDIGVDLLVAKEQIGRTFPEDLFKGKMGENKKMKFYGAEQGVEFVL